MSTLRPPSLAAADCRRLLRQRTGRDHVVLVGRAATAIRAALQALDLHGAAVLLPANTCYIVLWAVLQTGNQPFLVDVDAFTGNVTPAMLDSCAAPPAVVIPAHMYGNPAPMQALGAWARQRGVFVLEDSALALGALADGQPVGAWGGAAVFSFGRGKIADAGTGGALVTNDARLAAEVERFAASTPMWNSKLRALEQAWLEIYWALHQFEATPGVARAYAPLFEAYGAITRVRLPQTQGRDDHWRDLRAELARLDVQLEHRRRLARIYDVSWNGLPVRTLNRSDDAALWRYPLLVPADQRDNLLRALWDERIDVTRWYPSLQPMRGALTPALPVTPTPVADQLGAEIVNLPLSPETDEAAARRTVTVVRRFFEG